MRQPLSRFLFWLIAAMGSLPAVAAGSIYFADLCNVVDGRLDDMNRPGFTGGQNSRRIARYGTDIKEENVEAVFP
jgi:hypothetical protein